MKRALFFIILTAAVLAACTTESWSGSGRRDNETGRSYFEAIAEDLLTDNIIELEHALYADSLKTAGNKYKTNGKRLREAGAKWVLSSKSEFDGLVFLCEKDSVWTLSREGGYRIRFGSSFHTEYEINAVQLPDKFGRAKNHYAWEVRFQCTRTEERGYKAEIHTPDSLVFSGGTLGDWEKCNGVLLMEVTKYGTHVDGCRLEYFGSPSDCAYLRGL